MEATEWNITGKSDTNDRNECLTEITKMFEN